MGDFNAKIGKDNTGREQIMGKEGLGEISENGELFLDFCLTNDLVVGGSTFPHKAIHKATWVSPNHTTVNQIDHICINRRFRRSLQDVRTYRGADVASDHHLVVGKVQLKLRRFHRMETRPGIRFNTDLLRDQGIKEAFTIELSNKFQALANLDEEDAAVEPAWERIKNAFTGTCKEILGKRKRKQKPWISQATIRRIEERKKMKAKVNESKTRAQKAEAARRYSEANKDVKRSVAQDKRNYIEALAERAEQAAAEKNSKELYDTTKKLAGKFRATNSTVKDKSGKVLSNQKEQCERWKEYFEELLNRPPPTEPPVIPPAETTLPISTNRPTRTEIKKAIQMLRSGKAAGPDEIPPEALKADINRTVDVLHDLFGKIWESEEIPADWKHGHIVKIPKKGDIKECKNWRGITLLSIPGKVFNRVLLERMKGAVDKKLRDEQAGFRKERSCTDQIATLRMILEQSVEWNSSLYITFVDFEKAFDSVDRETLWKLLDHHGIPRKIINLIRNTYDPSTCQVIHDGSLTESFEIRTGVRQGCLLSPFLFLLAIDWVMREATQGKNRGIQWTMFRRLEDIDFADDIALLTHGHKPMQDKGKDVDATGGKIGLKVNVPKTKSMRTNSDNQAPICFRQEPVEDVEKFPYLGSIVTKDGGTDQDIQSRIGKATSAYKMLMPVWRSGSISAKTKLRIFSSNVKSVLLYGCETWRITKAGMTRLQTFTNRYLRYILRIRWEDRIANQELWERGNQEKIEVQVLRRKWNWLGHTLRKPRDNITRHALRWNPQGRRRPGRPRTTWRRSLEKEARQLGKTWEQIEATAQDRRRWKSLVSDLCSTWSDRV